MNRRLTLNLLTAACMYIASTCDTTEASTLVGNPFVSPTVNWVDAFPPPTRAGNWRLSLHNPTLMDTNNANPPTTGAVNNTGTHEPDVLVKNTFPGACQLRIHGQDAHQR